MAEEQRLNLHQKLVEVRKSIDGFTKDGESYNYSYVKGTQVLSKIIGKMNELGLLLYPSLETQSHEIFPYKDKKNNDKQDFLVYGNMNYKWVNAEKPDEEIIIPWKYTGQQDEISKAFGSGLTYAERYFLLKFFGVPTDADDPDAKQPKQTGGYNNNNSNYGNNNNYNKNSGQSSSNTGQPQQKGNNTQQGNDNTFVGITEGQVKAVNINLKNLSKLANTTTEKLIVRLEKECGQFGSVSGMSKGQASKAISLLKQWETTTKSKQGEQQ